MTRRNLCLVTSLVSAIAASATAHASPISATLYLQADARTGTAISFDSDSAAWGVPLTPLTVDVSAIAAEQQGVVAMAGNASATWGAGGNSGVFTGHLQWNVAAQNFTADFRNFPTKDWEYSFTADFDGTFAMSYDVTASGNPFGLSGWSISWDGPGGGLDLFSAADPTTAGTFSRSILSGQTYTVGLQNNANIGAPHFVTIAGAMDGRFEFSMTADRQQDPVVPEPASLLLVGTGLAAAARRVKARRASRM